MATAPSAADLTPAVAKRQIDASVSAVMGAADAAQANILTALTQVQQARLTRQNRGLADLTAEAEPDTDAVEAARVAVAATEAAVSRLTLGGQQAATKAPKVSAAGWVLHGRVYDSNLNPLERYTVFLVDAQKNYLDQYGFDYTDKTGYFLLSHAGGAAPGPAPGDGKAAPAESPAAAEIYLQVANPRARAVRSSAGAFTPVTGLATYQLVTLAEGEPELGDPPAAIKAVALPRGGKAKRAK